MDFLFFDIECCDGNHMCSFGYIIIDENFNVLEKKDIIMNPDAEFKLGRAGFDPTIELAYSKEEFEKQPLFTEFYETIENLLTSSNRIVFGHSVTSDIKYLQRACKRYKKEFFEITAHDTQKIFEWFKGEDRRYSLKDIINDLCIDISNIKQHKSDDALLTMFVAKEICYKQKTELIELIRRCKICKVESNDVYNHNIKEDRLAYSSDDNDKSPCKKLTAIEQAFQKAKSKV